MRLIAFGFALLLLGFLVIFLMVLRLIQPSFPWSFLAYAISFTGLLLGLVGAIQHRHP